MNAIETQDLRKVYKPDFLSRQSPCVALHELSLEIKKGAIYGLLGPNGAGKTTLLKILGGMIRPTSGRYAVNGSAGLFLSGHEGFWPFLTGRDNLEYFCALLQITGPAAVKKIEEMIRLFGMSAYIDRPAGWYSSGMKHRLLLSKALLNDPDILLLDEPVATLDPIGARDFHLMLRENLNKRLGKTILLSTHQVDEAQEIADTLGFLFQGRLVWEKSAAPFRGGQANLLEDYFQTVQTQLPR